MPVIQRAITVPANSINQNIIEGSQYEFARRRSIVQVGITCGTGGGILANINSGGDVVAEQFPVNPKNSFPIIPDEFVFSDVMEAGDRLSIPVQNTTGAGVVVWVIVQIQEI